MAGALLALTVVALALPALAATPKFPALEGRRVVDEANILSPAVEASLTGELEALETSTGRQLVVATVPTLQGYEIEDYGYQLGRHWGIGDKDRDDGALLIVAPAERKVRIEVGYGLEGVLTDALSSVIIQSAILPKFREGDLEGGVVAGTDAIVQQLSLPDEEARAKAASASRRSDGRDGFPPIPLIIVIVLILILLRVLGGGGWLPWLIIGGLSGGGGRGGGGWSGGGFSGGGGSFGGGGSSGSW
ncbi:MAG: TPM domain-containing protein [Pseudomonadota bacterium]